MPNRLSRRLFVTLVGGIGLAGCLDTFPETAESDEPDAEDGTASGASEGDEDESDAEDEGADDNVDLDGYGFEVEVPEGRRGEALESLLEGAEMINDSEEGDELYIDGEISSYADDGTAAELVIEYPEGYTDPDEDEDLHDTAYAAGEFLGEQIILNVLLGRYASNADSRPDTFEVRYIEDGTDEPFETSTLTAEEAAEFYEENADGTAA